MGTPVVVKESGRVAVRARFLGPTNYRGSRVKVTRMDARTGDKSLTVSWDHALDIGDNYAAAIRQYLDMMGWEGTWVMGGGDWFGELAWDGPRNAYGWPTRPVGMDGRARKIRPTRGGDAVWWQPPADVTDIDHMASVLSDILEYGYTVVVLETDDGRFATIGGVEPFADRDYLADVVGNFVWEIAHEINDDDMKRTREIVANAMFAVVGR